MSTLEGWLDEKQFPYLIQFADLMEGSLDGIVGREVLLDSISANLMREKMNNIILLGPAGTGKTSLMEGYAAIHRQESVMVLGVDLGVMGGDGDSKFAERISNLAKEVLLLTDLRHQQGITSDIIVFLDEMHLLTMHGHSGEGGGSSAGNAIKPLAARKGIKLIGATTDEEYQKYIKPDQALTRRFETVNVEEPDDFTVIEILQQFAKKSLPPEIYRTISVNTFYEIVQYANQYLPAFAQPAKSLGIMDLAIGYHRSRGRAINHELIRDIMLVKANVDVDFRTDIATVDRILREKVMGQDTAIDLVENRLFVANAGLQDKTKPVANFLFAGSTGVGKAIWDEELVPVYGQDVAFKRHGDLQVGDYVFNRYGKPVKVIGVYPQGLQEAYQVEFESDAKVICNDEHLWTWKYIGGNGGKNWKTSTLRALMDKGVSKMSGDRVYHPFCIPSNEAIEWSRTLSDDMPSPYTLGVLLGDGCLTEKPLAVSSNDEKVCLAVAEDVGAVDVKKPIHNYTWYFYKKVPSKDKYGSFIQLKDVLKEFPELINLKSNEKFIPDCYKYGSIEDRWLLIQGLFDTDGHISTDSRYRVSYSTSSFQLAQDVEFVLASLGVKSRVRCYRRNGKSNEYRVVVRSVNQDKSLFFKHSPKYDVAVKASLTKSMRIRKLDHTKLYDVVDLNKKLPMTCIMVDDPEHLYQVTRKFIVTHNTELTKAIAESMFGSSDKMIRFDMSEYALEGDVRLFQRRVSSAIDKTPYSVVLFDEFDKACREIMNLLLGILDDGRLSDEYGRQTTFTNAIVILTTNAAADTFKDAKLHNIGLDEMEKMIRGELGKVFSPEFLGRFDEIVPFGTLEEIHFEKIAQMKLAKLVTQMQLDYNCRLKFDSKVMRYLLFERFDALMDPAAGGGRAMSRRIDREITPLIARAVDSARFHHERITEMTVYVDGVMAADRKDMLKGSSVLAVKFKTASKKDGVLKGNATTVAYTQK